MTTVVIDLERLRNLSCGLGQFSLHLGRAILDLAGDEANPVLLLPRGGERHFAPRSVRKIFCSTWRRDSLIGWLRPLIGWWPRPSAVDVWHVTHQDSKFWPVDPRVPVVMTVHDLNFLREKPPHVIRRRLSSLRRKVARATVLTTGSEHAAREIREHVPLARKELRVIPHGICLDRTVTPQCPAAVDPQARFLFTIGDITPKKNFHVLVDLLARLPEYTLVIAGSKANAYASLIERRAAELQLSHRVVLPGCVTEPERNWLYEHCAGFVFPSLTEGFGLPLIEAMSYGRPVFAARRTSLPEVGGPWAFFWDEFDADQMAHVFHAGMSQYAANPEYPKRLREWADRFSWPVAAGQYLELYREVGKGRGSTS